MHARVLIRHNPTGEERWYTDEWSFNHPKETREESLFLGEFVWTDGNFSCDCNRALLFARAEGQPDPDNRECGDSEYTAVKAVLDDGTEVELDAPPLSERGSRPAATAAPPPIRIEPVDPLLYVFIGKGIADHFGIQDGLVFDGIKVTVVDNDSRSWGSRHVDHL